MPYKDKEVRLEKAKGYCKKWGDKMRREGRCRQCAKKKEFPQPSLCRDCQDKENSWYRRQSVLTRTQVLEHYGNACACCGETINLFLGVDHINNDGHKERSGRVSFYRRIIREGFPDCYRILCHNCNLGRYLNGGTCPHGNGV